MRPANWKLRSQCAATTGSHTDQISPEAHAVPSLTDNTVTILTNDGHGTLTKGAVMATGTYPYFLATGDVNADGKPDVATSNRDANSISAFISHGEEPSTRQPTLQPDRNRSVLSSPMSTATAAATSPPPSPEPPKSPPRSANNQEVSDRCKLS